MPVFQVEVPVAGSVELPPDPRSLDGLGRNHSLATALADLVDNSVDAGASEVLIRFVRRAGRLRALYVVDNGHGMGESGINAAMTVGGRRSYGAGDLGRFGVGLKAASFSQASSVTVLSKTASTPPVGRRWALARIHDSFRCDIVADDFCWNEFDRPWGIADLSSGTIIRWDEVRGFPATDDPARVEGFLTAMITAVRSHIGLVLHRFLAKATLRVSVDVEDVEYPTPGLRFGVEPIDPFGYPRSGRADYPKTLIADVAGGRVLFDCHVWPARRKTPDFLLPGGPVEHQGLYFYRHDRLLQAGGEWGGLHSVDPALQLARVAVDIRDDMTGLFQMNPEKSRVLTQPDFAAVAESARSEDGSGFAEFLRSAQECFRLSRKRRSTRRTMLPAGKGFSPALRSSLTDEIPTFEREQGIDIRWRVFDTDTFFEVDREARTLWLNQRYRPDPPGLRHSVNDVPLLKALMYLLVEEVFEGQYLGAKDKDNIVLWQEILTTAARTDEGPL